MADKFLEELTLTTGLNMTDVVYLVRLPDTDPNDYQITWANVMAQIETDIVFPHSLEYHHNVAAGASNTQVLKFTGGINEWAGGWVEWTELMGKPLTFPPDPHSFTDHDDADDTGKVDRDAMLWDLGTATWKPNTVVEEIPVGILQLEELGRGTHKEEIDHGLSVVGGAIRYTIDNLDNPGTVVTFYMREGDLWELTVPDFLVLPEATDTVPILYYVYLDIDTGVPTLKFTTDILALVGGNATLLAETEVQSAATVDTEGPLTFRSMSHHIEDHLAHLNNVSRVNIPPNIFSGIDYTNTLTLTTQLDIAHTSGIVWGLHYHLYPARNTALGDEITLGNDPTTAFRRIANVTLVTIPTDALGGTLQNRWFNIVVGMTMDTDGTHKFVLNLPEGSYGTSAQINCENDIDMTAVYADPFIQESGLILLYRQAMKFANNGTITLGETFDLREGIVGGGSGGGGISDNTVIVADIDLVPRFAAGEIQFNNGSVTDAGGGIAHVDIAAHTLTELTDVNLPTPLLRDGMFYDGALWAIDRRMNWMGEWDGRQYEIDDVVIDGEWTMIANTQTADRPAPQPTGDPFYFYSGTLVPFQNSAKSVTFGNRYTFPRSGYVTGYRIDTVVGNEYIVYTVTDPLGAAIANQLLSFTATASGWSEFSINPTIVQAGEVFDLVCIVNEPDPTPTTFTGDWNYITPQNASVPVAGTAVHANSSSGSIRFAYLDDAAADRSGQLTAITPGDIIEAFGIRWSVQSVSDVSGGSYVAYGVSPAVQGAPDGIETFTFETVSATPITIGREVDAWLAEAAAEGLFIIDGDYADIVPDNNAYGTDIQVQEAIVSADWDLVAFSAGGGSSGGGGGLTPHVLDYHTDVTAPTPSEDDILQYKSGDWVNQAIGSGTPHAIGDHTDVIYTGLTGQHYFRYDGSAWRNSPLDLDDAPLWNGPYVPIAGGSFTGQVNFTGTAQSVWSVTSTNAFTIQSASNAQFVLQSTALADAQYQFRVTTGGVFTLRQSVSSSYITRCQFLLSGSVTLNIGDWYIPSGAALFQRAAAAGDVSMGPNISDGDTGMGWHSANRAQLIGGGVAALEWSSAEVIINKPLDYNSAEGAVKVTSTGTSVAPNTDAFNYWDVTATADITITVPSVSKVGYVGVMRIKASGGDRTITWQSGFFDSSGNDGFSFVVDEDSTALVTFTAFEADVWMVNYTLGYVLG